MKTSYAHNPLSLHPTASSGRLYSDCNPSTVVLGVKGRRTEEAVGWRAPAFTIVELLIVIVVIGILAAISIAAYAGISQSARDSSAKASAKQLATKLETTYVQDGAYPSALSDIGIRNTDTTSYQYTSSPTTNPPSWCSTVTVGSTSYYVSNTTATPTKGGCPGHGQGGVEAVTNYAVDPSAQTSSSNFLGSGANPAGITKSIATDKAHRGLTSLKQQILSVGSDGTGARAVVQNLVTQPGESIAWSFWVYSTRTGELFPWAEGSKTLDNTYAACGGTRVLISANTWTRVTATCVSSPTSGIKWNGIGSYNLAVQPGDIVWFDEFMVTKGSKIQNYADGSSDNWIWNGTPNASTSTGPAL